MFVACVFPVFMTVWPTRVASVHAVFKGGLPCVMAFFTPTPGLAVARNISITDPSAKLSNGRFIKKVCLVSVRIADYMSFLKGGKFLCGMYRYRYKFGKFDLSPDEKEEILPGPSV